MSLMFRAPLMLWGISTATTIASVTNPPSPRTLPDSLILVEVQQLEVQQSPKRLRQLLDLIPGQIQLLQPRALPQLRWQRSQLVLIQAKRSQVGQPSQVGRQGPCTSVAHIHALMSPCIPHVKSLT